MLKEIKGKLSGVYQIECIVNGKRYVGASVDVKNRVNQHFYKQCRERYSHLDMYKDIKKYGKEGFQAEVLELINPDKLLESEQKWYDKLNPDYNIVRPCEKMTLNPEVRRRSLESEKNIAAIENRRRIYNTEKYQKFFRTFRKDMRPVEVMKDDETVGIFISIRDAARWVDNNTDYKSKNKASKIKAVCDGERLTAFGYKYKYSNKSVETILKGSRYSIDTNIEAVNS